MSFACRATLLSILSLATLSAAPADTRDASGAAEASRVEDTRSRMDGGWYWDEEKQTWVWVIFD